MGTVDTIVGLDNISDYSDNFTEDKDIDLIVELNSSL